MYYVYCVRETLAEPSSSKGSLRVKFETQRLRHSGGVTSYAELERCG